MQVNRFRRSERLNDLVHERNLQKTHRIHKINILVT